ncbi:MAG: MFS transporter [Gammaproteobacteria bacterium]|nr:MFS transporter [Gammaproteobacteria bacterium]
MYEFLLRTIVGTFQIEIQTTLGLSLITFAVISSSAYQLAYGFMQIPVGFIVRRFGLKKTAFLATTLCAISAMLFGLSSSFADALIYRIVMGLGSSFGFICLLVAVYEWMPRQHLGLFIGLAQFIGTTGPMIAGGPVNVLIQDGYGFKSVFTAIGIIGFIIAALILVLVKNNVANKPNEVRYIAYQEPVWTSMKKIFQLKQTWYIAIFSGSVFFAIEYLSENEGMIFLRTAGYSAKLAAYMISLSWFGHAIGCPLLGFISDRIQRRKVVMIIAASSALFGVCCIFYLTHIQPLMMLGFLMLGIGAAGQSVGFVTIAEECQKQYVAAGMGFNNSMLMIFPASLGPIIGFLLTSISGGKNEGFSMAEFHLGFSVIVAFVAVALIMAVFFIRETFCKPQKEILIC